MAKYHISKDGTPGLCKAVGTCPLGGSESHFDSQEAAQAESQKRMEQQFGVINSDTLNTGRTKEQYVNDLVDEFSGEVPLYEVKLKNGETFKDYLFNDKKGNLVRLGEDSNDRIPISSIDGIIQERSEGVPSVESVTNKAIKSKNNNEKVSFNFEYDTVRGITIKNVDSDGFIEFEEDGDINTIHVSSIDSIENELDEKASSSKSYKNNPTVEFKNGKTTTAMKFKSINENGDYVFYDKNGRDKVINSSEISDIRASSLDDSLLDSSRRDKSITLKFNDGASKENVSYLYEDDSTYTFSNNNNPSYRFNVQKDYLKDIDIID